MDITVPVATREHRPARTFLRYLAEMTAAMFVGMFAFAMALGPIATAVGSSFESVRLAQPALFMFGMCSAMSVMMVAWMRHRRHSWRDCWEMTAAMLVPVLGVLAGYWLDGIPADSVCPLSCASMIPAMAGAMLFRRGVYTIHRANPT